MAPMTRISTPVPEVLPFISRSGVFGSPSPEQTPPGPRHDRVDLQVQPRGAQVQVPPTAGGVVVDHASGPAARGQRPRGWANQKVLDDAKRHGHTAQGVALSSVHGDLLWVDGGWPGSCHEHELLVLSKLAYQLHERVCGPLTASAMVGRYHRHPYEQREDAAAPPARRCRRCGPAGVAPGVHPARRQQGAGRAAGGHHASPHPVPVHEPGAGPTAQAAAGPVPRHRLTPPGRPDGPDARDHLASRLPRPPA